ncbi:NUDIX hydrolase [Butyrivibrio sp. FCS014]|uniref:NUDIX hydrolase n=1 Tax=Butyrivibrio sp. FCS014 TaxID=1408304 RepID=UPI000463DB4C|nr:NUDIX domain-containing protein [Butyrivibrio sp. FCS014]
MTTDFQLTTLCYLERDDKYLMLHRVSKKNDINKDKWIGVGGHFEDRESPEECVKREVLEETGYDIPLEDFEYRGIVTFISDKGDYELMSLFTAPCPDGEPAFCNEGELVFVGKKDVYDLNLWEGDRIFFRLLEERRDFFSLKMTYDIEDNLREAVLDGKDITP